MKEMRVKSLGCERVVERINMFMYIGFESTLIAKLLVQIDTSLAHMFGSLR